MATLRRQNAVVVVVVVVYAGHAKNAYSMRGDPEA